MPGRSTPSKIKLRTWDAMCSPLGVRTSFSWRLPFDRPLAAVGELEVDDGMRISYANQRTKRPISTFSPPSVPQPGAWCPHGPGVRGDEMNNIYNPSNGACADVFVHEADGVRNRWAKWNEDGDDDLAPSVLMNRTSP